MRKVVKKLYIAMMSVVLLCITMVATTYAWIGIYANSSFDPIDIGLKSTGAGEYGIELSLTGAPNSFSSNLDMLEVKKCIMKNMGIEGVDSLSDAGIDSKFSSITMMHCSSELLSNNKFAGFYDVYGTSTNKYYTFDIYISVKRLYDEDVSDSKPVDYSLNVYLTGELFKSRSRTSNMINQFSYPSTYVNPDSSSIINGGFVVDKQVNVKPENAARIAIQKYEIVEKGKVESYTDSSTIIDCIIYQGGTQNPTYNSVDNSYSFGGILPTSENLALFQWNSMFTPRNVPEWALTRGDQEYNPAVYNKIIDKSEGITVEKMMKLTITFWFEGWDADCFDVIDSNPVDLNFIFTTLDI